MEKKLIIYTDGASRGNPGKGGYGVVLLWGNTRKELSAAYRMTTNNRMELMGVIAALETLKRKGLKIEIYTDSQYIVRAIKEGWLSNWLKKGFKKVKNKDLWTRYYELSKDHEITFNWVKGHDTNIMNNRCDFLATTAADNGPYLVDEGYESGMYS